jgi:hypothetical protein
MNEADYSVFEYLYRDGANYKAWGELLLKGRLNEQEITEMRGRFDGGDCFIAEQIDIPTLYEALWEDCDGGRSSSDHVWHEFHVLRPASADEVKTLPLWGEAQELLKKITRVERWNESLSQNWD